MTLCDFVVGHEECDLFIGRNGQPGESFECLDITVSELMIGGLMGSVTDNRWFWDGNNRDLISHLPNHLDIYMIRAN